MPPKEGWWVCSTGLTPLFHTQVFDSSKDFCVLVQLIPKLIYHSYNELFDRWDGGFSHPKRELLH